MSTSSTTTGLADSSKSAPGQSRRLETSFRPEPILWYGIAIALIPAVLQRSIILWHQPHYLLFPVVYVAILVFIWQVHRAASEMTRTRSILTSVAFVIGFVIFCIAVLTASPYLGQISGLMFLCSYLLSLGKRLGLLHIATVAAFFGLTAIPGSISETIENQLASATTWAAAGTLETLSIPNLARGIVIETSNQMLVVSEACHGFESLFVMFCVAGLFLIWKPQSLAMLVLTSIALVVCAVLGDSLRVVSIAGSMVWWKFDLQNGVAGYVFHYAMVLLMALLALSVIAFVRLMIAVIPPPRDKEEPAVSVLAYNSFVEWPLPSSWTIRPSRESGTGTQTKDGGVSRPSPDSAYFIAKLAGLAVMLLLSFGYWIFWFTADPLPVRAPFGREIVDRLPGENSLDPLTLGFTSLKWERETRFPRHPMGQYAHVWQASGPEATITFNFLVPSAPVLSKYFDSPGMEVISQDVWSPTETPGDLAFYEFEIKNTTTGIFALYLYGMFDRAGTVVEQSQESQQQASRFESLIERLKSGPLSLVIGKSTANVPVPVNDIYQLQYMAMSTQSMGTDEKNVARKRFTAIFLQLRNETIAAEKK